MKRRTVLAAALLASTLASAQGSYPSKPVTLIVPFPPGGLADIVGRPVAEALSRELGQPVIVENKAGAGGGIGMGIAARAPADGYTLLLSLSSLTVLPEADALLGRAPMYALNALRPIARFTADPTVLAVRTTMPWRSSRYNNTPGSSEPLRVPIGNPSTAVKPMVLAMLLPSRMPCQS